MPSSLSLWITEEIDNTKIEISVIDTSIAAIFISNEFWFNAVGNIHFEDNQKVAMISTIKIIIDIIILFFMVVDFKGLLDYK